MSKTRKKNAVLKILFGVMMLLLLSIGTSTITALPAHAMIVEGSGVGGGSSGSVTTTNLYNIYFDYDHKRGAYISTANTDVSSGTNVIQADNINTGEDGSLNLYFQIYGSAYNSTTENLAKGGYIGSSTITIRTNSTFQQHSFKITNSSGTVIATSSATSVTAYNLTDGIYYMTYTGGSEWYEDTNIRRHFFATTITATSYFRVDLTAPTISGASLTTTGKCTNSAFTVSATDSGLGVDSMYMKGPNDSSWMSCGSSKTVAANSTNGLYQFYAKDKGGNSSATYYVYYDTAKPTVTIKNDSGTNITDTATNGGFKASASDTGCGVNYLQYKCLSDTSWQSYTSGTLIADSSPNDTYMFRAVDKAGNISDIEMITLDTVKPTVRMYGASLTFINGDKVNSNYIRFAAADTLSGIKAIYVKMPGQSSYVTYSEGTQYTTNGLYSVYSVDNAGNISSTFMVTLDNTAPEISCSQTEFYESTANDFTVKATDNASAVTLYYKTPLMSDFSAASGNSYSVTTNDFDGKYYFYAVDDLGNSSETKWIELNVDTPTATIDWDKQTNKYRITWDGNSTGTLNGKSYTKGTWISTEGEYTFIITNSSNRSKTYSFTITHLFIKDKVIAPTCTENGYTIYKCLSCNTKYNLNSVNATGHDYQSVLVGESCTEGAYYVYTCKVCGYQYNSDYISQGGHKYVTKTTAPTCIERGFTTYTCSVCGDSFQDDYTSVRGHSFTNTTINPTCTESGYTHYECKNCDYEYDTDYLPAHGHNYETTVIEANCSDMGYTLNKCSYCGDEYKTGETLALGHNYNETKIEENCTQSGCVRHTCVRCGYVYDSDVVPALGHKYVSEVTQQVTCDVDGNRHHICTRCGDQYNTAIPHFGHTFEINDERNEGGNVKRLYKCEVCGYSYTQELENQYEEVSNYVEYLFQQYSPYMIYIFLATSGVWSIAMGVAIIIAKKNEEKEKAKKMIVNYCIGMVVIFVILVAAPLLVRGIAALIAG